MKILTTERQTLVKRGDKGGSWVRWPLWWIVERDASKIKYYDDQRLSHDGEWRVLCINDKIFEIKMWIKTVVFQNYKIGNHSKKRYATQQIMTIVHRNWNFNILSVTKPIKSEIATVCHKFIHFVHTSLVFRTFYNIFQIFSFDFIQSNNLNYLVNNCHLLIILFI